MILLLGLVFCAILPTSSLQATKSADNQSNQNFSIAGNVYYGDTGKPAEHITVELRGSDETLHAPEATTGTGGFEFRRLVRGNYALVIETQAYETVNMPIDISFNSIRGLDIYLKPKGSGPNVSKTGIITSHELSMPQKARDLVQSGRKKLFLNKDPRGALEDFLQAAAIAPDYYEADYQIALAYLALGNASDAEKNFRKSIDVSHDNYGEANIGLGKILLDKGDVPAAEKALLRGVELSPTSSRGFYELGRAQLTEKKLQEAEKSADKSRSLSPDFPMVYRLLSNIHLQEKNYAALAADLDAYIKLDPASPAGQRAKQMREQLQEQLAKRNNAAEEPAKP